MTTSKRASPSGYIRWTYDLRLGLHLLKTRQPILSGTNVAEVFSILYEDHLRACGVQNGVLTSRLNSQYHDRGPADWAIIVNEPVSAAEKRKRHSLSKRIEEVIERAIPGIARRMPAVPSVPVPEPRRQHHLSTVVKSGLETTPVTPQIRKLVPYIKGNGGSCMLTPEQYEKTHLPVAKVSDSEAHPQTIQFTGLLFRTWQKHDTLDHNNSPTGFWSRKHFGTLTLSDHAPPAEHIDPADVKHHLNRDIRITPFISTSNRIFWMFRNSFAQLRASGEADINLSILRRSAMQETHLFHARPYHNSIISKAELDNGAQRYCGHSEFWAWQNIKPEAIIKTVPFARLIAEIQEDPEMAALFRLRTFMDRMSSQRQQRVLADDAVSLSLTIVSAIAKFAKRLGITARDTIELRHVVSDVLEGWQIKPTFQPVQNWWSWANAFSHYMSSSEVQPLSFAKQQELRMSFLEGVRFSMAKPNAAHQELPALQKRWIAVGLGSTEEILHHEALLVQMTHRKLLLADKKNREQLGQHYAKLTTRTIVSESGSPMKKRRRITNAETAEDDDDDLYDTSAARNQTHHKRTFRDWRDAAVETFI